jgi:hypothetical protein
VNDPERMSCESSAITSGGTGEDRKLYRKPSFRYEQVFETMALQCGKIDPTSGSCRFVKMAS